MEPSETNINLHPERRQRQTSALTTETSPFFEPSKSNKKLENNSSNHRTNEADEPPPTFTSKLKPPRGRQTVLNFTNGHLSTKLPLTNPVPRTYASRMSLADIAKDTLSLLPGLLATRPDVGTEGYLLQPADLAPLPSHLHPNLPPTTIRVLDSDTLSAALSLQTTTSSPSNPPVCILNMANATHAGGGFRHGALAQEETLCYRTSLPFTLKLRYYPLPDESAIFSPRVLVIRESISDGHALLDFTVPARLPVVSVVSCAAVCLPVLTKPIAKVGGSSYAKQSDRQLMLAKIRLILRVCVSQGCRRVVLGAFGCGAFANPPGEVAEMWKAVLGETEFQGCWEEMVFAVLDGRRDDNFEVFKMVLHGLKV